MTTVTFSCEISPKSHTHKNRKQASALTQHTHNTNTNGSTVYNTPTRKPFCCVFKAAILPLDLHSPRHAQGKGILIILEECQEESCQITVSGRSTVGSLFGCVSVVLLLVLLVLLPLLRQTNKDILNFCYRKCQGAVTRGHFTPTVVVATITDCCIRRQQCSKTTTTTRTTN